MTRTPYEPANDPQDTNVEDIDAMEVDHDNGDNDQDEAQLEGEKRTLREATPDHNSERNTLRKAFPERPSMAQLEGEKETLAEAMPGQPSEVNMDGEPTPERLNLSRPLGPGSQDGGQRRSNKVEEHQDKVAPLIVNEDTEERPDVRCSSRIRQPTEHCWRVRISRHMAENARLKGRRT